MIDNVLINIVPVSLARWLRRYIFRWWPGKWKNWSIFVSSLHFAVLDEESEVFSYWCRFPKKSARFASALCKTRKFQSYCTSWWPVSLAVQTGNLVWCTRGNNLLINRKCSFVQLGKTKSNSSIENSVIIFVTRTQIYQTDTIFGWCDTASDTDAHPRWVSLIGIH